MKRFKDIRNKTYTVFEETDAQRVDEAPLVMSDMDIVKSLTQKIEDDLHKLKIRKQFEKGWSTVQALAKLAGYKVTKTAQQKGKTFRYDIKK